MKADEMGVTKVNCVGKLWVISKVNCSKKFCDFVNTLPYIKKNVLYQMILIFIAFVNAVATYLCSIFSSSEL